MTRYYTTHLPYLIIVLIVLQSSSFRSDKPLVNAHISLQKLVDSLNVDEGKLSVLIDKSNYRLAVLADEKTIKEYPVVFGGDPVNDKLMQGDQCTPEGVFKIRDYYPHNKWSKFIWIDYPNEDSWKKHREAKENGRIPANANIGGEIGIHGVPKGYDHAIPMKINWTLGCISLRNEDVNELYPFVFKGMKVIIQK